MRRIFGPLLLVVSVSASLAWAEDWPQWRGPARTGISSEKGLLAEWPAGGPAVRWQRTDIGTG
ncbi:MAG: polyvinylalcohol dehydrogenase, partial [Planctomycetaceae bacterium]